MALVGYLGYQANTGAPQSTAASAAGIHAARSSYINLVSLPKCLNEMGSLDTSLSYHAPNRHRSVSSLERTREERSVEVSSPLLLWIFSYFSCVSLLLVYLIMELLTQKQKRRIREEKPGNWKFARVRCPRKQRDSWLGVSLVGFNPNNNQILDCAYWSLFWLWS